MDFKKYNSIKNSYENEFINKIKNIGYKGPWYVSEKIHGANCQIAITNEGIKIGGRNEVVDDPLWKKVILEYEEEAKALFNSIDAKRIILFGEFFGGSYPHPDVPRDKNARKIQKGVWYSPSNHVIFFDLYVEPITGIAYYVNVKSLIYLFSSFEIPLIDFKKLETLEDALDYPNDEISYVYKRYNLPEIKGNIREGVVIRPEENLWIGQARAIIKNKNDKFKEVQKERKPSIDQKELNEKQVIVLEGMLRYTTENKVLNILSHYGPNVSISSLGQLIQDTNKEIQEEFERNNNILNSMEKSEIKEVTRRVNKEVSRLCKKVIINYMNGN